MMTFFSDLDNTLIYSHRKEIIGKKIPAELLSDRIQSYMTEFTYNFLKNSDFLRLIPVTTRTAEQYERIFLLGDEIPCDMALVCNGGVLLKNGVPDTAWREETLRIAEEELPSIEKANQLLTESVEAEHVHFIEPFFVYAKCDKPQEFAKKLISCGDISGYADINCDSRKLYCTAKSVTKGNAVKRLKKRIDQELYVAAGDSLFDVSMLNCADVALASEEIADMISAPKVYSVGSGIISDRICEKLAGFERLMHE